MRGRCPLCPHKERVCPGKQWPRIPCLLPPNPWAVLTPSGLQPVQAASSPSSLLLETREQVLTSPLSDCTQGLPSYSTSVSLPQCSQLTALSFGPPKRSGSQKNHRANMVCIRLTPLASLSPPLSALRIVPGVTSPRPRPADSTSRHRALLHDPSLCGTKQMDATTMQDEVTGTHEVSTSQNTPSVLTPLSQSLPSSEIMNSRAQHREEQALKRELTAAAEEIIKSKYQTSEIVCRRSLNPYPQPFCSPY